MGKVVQKNPTVVFANAPREMPSLLKGNWKRVITQKNDLIKSWILSRQRIAQCTQLIAKDRRPQFVNNYICQSGHIHLPILDKYICQSWTNTFANLGQIQCDVSKAEKEKQIRALSLIGSKSFGNVTRLHLMSTCRIWAKGSRQLVLFVSSYKKAIKSKRYFLSALNSTVLILTNMLACSYT